MDVRIGVVDVGSNTIRLLLAQVEGTELVALEKERVRLALGAEIERTGVVSDVSIAAAAKAVGKLCALARRGGAETLDVFLTAPGRQSENAEQLTDALTRAAEHSVRILSTEEEGRLAYAGAVATVDIALPQTIAVCDVGGASTEIAVGRPGAAPKWVESIDLGSVRLTERVIGAPANARAAASSAFASVSPPRVQAALAVGGSARAARRLVGPWLG
jgi:exopolyphosphatase/guanosine-5'-triphosphate,3'-diphosphate pyrophosphatase